jgi:hypothetical protein
VAGKRSWRWLRFIAGAVVAGALALVVLWTVALPRWVRPREREVVVVTDDEAAAEAARVASAGLIVRRGGVVAARPFEPPWTSRSLVAPEAWEPRGFKRFLAQRASVRADLLLRDLDVLEAVMSRAYGGWDSAAARGWRWDDWFADWRARLRAAGARRLAASEAFAPLDALLRFQLDNHTQIPLGRFDTMHIAQTALLASTPAGLCTERRGSDGAVAIAPADPAQAVRRALVARRGGALEPVAYVAGPDEGLEALRCGGAWIDVRRVSRSTSSLLARAFAAELHGVERPTIRLLSPEVAYARLLTMTAANYARVEQDRQAWPRPTGRERALVVDLRGNFGNASQLGLYALRDWVPPARLPAKDPLTIEVTASCLTAPLAWERDRSFLDGAPPDASTRAWLQGELDALGAPAPPGCPRVVHASHAAGPGYRAHRLQERAPGLRIVALVDNGCASDCEALVAELASLPETIVVGVNTAGVGQFVQPGNALLPHTGLPFRIALGQSDVYGDGRSFDGHGLDVDVVLPHPEDWGDGDLAQLARELAAR